MKNIDEIPFKLCKYLVESCIIYIPGEEPYELDVDEQFTAMLLEKDYDLYTYPFFEIMISVPNSIYRKMKLNSNNLHIYLLIKYAFFEKDDVADTIQAVKKYEFINDTFYIFMEEDGTEVTDLLQKTVEDNTLYDEKQGTNVSDASEIRLLLYKEDLISFPKLTCHNVIKECTVTDAVTLLLNRIGVKKVLMSPSNNDKKYHEFIIPEVRIIESLERLCNDYALHEHGTSIFFDYDLTYLIDKGFRCTAWQPGEKKLNYVVCQPMVSTYRSISGVYIDDEENVNYLTMKVTKNKARSLKSEQLYGSKLRVINNKTGEVIFCEIDNDEIKRVDMMNDIGITRTIIVNTGEVDTMQALMTRLKEKSMSWTVNLDNTLPTLLTPNKDYNFVFTDSSQTKYNGYYRLGRFVSTFTKNDGLWFSVQTLASFYGTKK